MLLLLIQLKSYENYIPATDTQTLVLGTRIMLF